MLGYQPWLCMKHNLIADVVKPRWFLKIVCSKQFAFFTYELSKGQSLTSSRANCVHECVSYCCNSVHCSVDYCVIMHQSIPAAPSFPLPPPSLSIRCFWGERGKMEAKKGESLRLPPPPGLLRGICPPCQSRGWGISKFCTARAFANPGAIPELLTRTQFPNRRQLHRRFYWKKSRLAHLSRTGINWRGL